MSQPDDIFEQMRQFMQNSNQSVSAEQNPLFPPRPLDQQQQLDQLIQINNVRRMQLETDFARDPADESLRQQLLNLDKEEQELLNAFDTDNLFPPLDQTIDNPGLNHGQFNHGQLNHGQLNHGQLNHGQLNHGQFNRSQLDLDQLNQLNHGELGHDHMQGMQGMQGMSGMRGNVGINMNRGRLNLGHDPVSINLDQMEVEHPDFHAHFDRRRSRSVSPTQNSLSRSVSPLIGDGTNMLAPAAVKRRLTSLLAVEVPSSDRRKFRSFMLPNGMEVLLVNEPLSRGTVALSVAAGSKYDPPEFPGLAQFVQRLVTCGSKKFPGVGTHREYFLSKADSSAGAITMFDITIHTTQVVNQFMRGSIERIMRCVSEPLFPRDAVDAELDYMDEIFNRESKKEDARYAQLEKILIGGEYNKPQYACRKTLFCHPNKQQNSGFLPARGSNRSNESDFEPQQPAQPEQENMPQDNEHARSPQDIISPQQPAQSEQENMPQPRSPQDIGSPRDSLLEEPQQLSSPLFDENTPQQEQLESGSLQEELTREDSSFQRSPQRNPQHSTPQQDSSQQQDTAGQNPPPRQDSSEQHTPEQHMPEHNTSDHDSSDHDTPRPSSHQSQSEAQQQETRSRTNSATEGASDNLSSDNLSSRIPVSAEDRKLLLDYAKEFFRKYYVPARMKLVVYASQKLDLVEKWVNHMFGQIPMGTTVLPISALVPPMAFADPPNARQFPYTGIFAHMLHESLEDGAKMIITFPIPDQRLLYESNPCAYYAYILEIDEPASLVGRLRDAGLVTSMQCGYDHKNEGLDTFKIEISLTSQGETDAERVAALIFAYLDEITRLEPNPAMFEVMQGDTQSELAGRQLTVFAEIISVLELMQLPIPRERLFNYHVPSKFEPESIKSVANFLSFDNSLTTLISANVANECDQQDDLMGIRYATQQMKFVSEGRTGRIFPVESK